MECTHLDSEVNVCLLFFANLLFSHFSVAFLAED